MDIDLMISSFPKLINATFVTLKLLSASLLIGIFLGLFFAILRINKNVFVNQFAYCLLYTSPSPRDRTRSRMPSSA